MNVIISFRISFTEFEDKEETAQARWKHRIVDLRFGNVKFSQQLQRSTDQEEEGIDLGSSEIKDVRVGNINGASNMCKFSSTKFVSELICLVERHFLTLVKNSNGLPGTSAIWMYPIVSIYRFRVSMILPSIICM